MVQDPHKCVSPTRSSMVVAAYKITAVERIKLQDRLRWQREDRAEGVTAPAREVLHARIILLTSEGLSNKEVAKGLSSCKCPEGGVVTAAAGGPKIVEKGKLSDAVVVDVLIKKYLSHLPLYRQAADLQRDCEIELSRSTLNSAVMTAGELLLPLAAVLKRDLLEGEYIQADETPIGVQSNETRGRNHQGYEFQYSRPGGPVVFAFCMSRAREGPAKFLRDYGGILQCDGYQGYEKIGAPGIVRAGCLAHVRRKFNDALKLDPKDREATAVLLLMGKLYAVENEARQAGATVQERLAMREQRSVALFDELKAKITQIALHALPSSKLAEACQYALNQWARLKVYLQNGRVEIDQNLCENAMRPLALGRKNWLHVGSEAAGPKIAAILSIMETCKRLQINLRKYLNDAFAMGRESVHLSKFDDDPYPRRQT